MNATGAVHSTDHTHPANRSARPDSFSSSSPTYHYPTPDAEGVRKTRELILKKSGKDVTDEEAYRLLAAAMRWLFLLNLNNLDTQELMGSPDTGDAIRDAPPPSS